MSKPDSHFNIVGRTDDMHTDSLIDMGVLKGQVSDEGEMTEISSSQKIKDLGVVHIKDIPLDQIN